MNRLANIEKPRLVTFTGFDDRTPISNMMLLSDRFPVEWGVLVSKTNRDARFPSEQAIKELSRAGLRLSCHLCGQAAYDYQTRNQMLPRYLEDRWFSRIQVNGDWINLLPRSGGTIYQSRDETGWPEYDAVDYLFDQSGGRGQVSEVFPPCPLGKYVGYSGGITPENVTDILFKIGADKGCKYWIDIETGVRTNGWFDLNKCRRILKAVYDDEG